MYNLKIIFLFHRKGVGHKGTKTDGLPLVVNFTPFWRQLQAVSTYASLI